MNSRWYRACVWYSALLWLTVLFAVGSLALVTAPAALVAVYDQAGRLVRDGATPTWRGFTDAMRRRGVTATIVTLLLAVPTMGLGLVAARSTSAVLVGAALGAGLVLSAMLAVAPLVVSLGIGGTGVSLTRTVAALVLRPVTALAASASWAVTALVLSALPEVVAVPLYAVAVSLPAYLTCLAAHRLRRSDTGRSENPRTIAVRSVLQPRSVRPHEGAMA